MTICLSHGGTTTYSADAPSNDLLVATAGGVVFLKRAGPGQPWSIDRVGLPGRHVVALAREPRTGALIAGTHDGGLEISEDFGATWEQRSQGIASQNVYSVAFTHVNGTTRLYAGTEPAHLYVSTDMGRRWRELAALRAVPSVGKWTFPAPPHDAHVINISAHPHDANMLFACVEQGGLFKSMDGGESWRELQGFNDDVHRALIPAGKPDCVFLPTGYGFYRSDDAGDSWINLSERIKVIGYPDPMVIHPRKESVMFVAGGEADPYHWMQTKSANPHIARTRDGGETWQILAAGLPERLDASFEAMSIEAWPGNAALYLGNTDGEIWSSDDEGDTWQRAACGLPPVSKTIHHVILRHDLSFDKHERPGA